MKDNNLSTKQQEILDYIMSEIQAKGYPPTAREIGRRVNLSSTSSVHANLAKLEAMGYIRRDPSKPRTIEICNDEFNSMRKEMVSIPFVGRVAAGEPILAEQNIEGYFPYPAEELSAGSDALFMLEIHGDSILVRYANGLEEKIPAPNLNGGGHNGADMVTLRNFFDYVDAGIPEASEPERILSSVMIPMAAMSNQLVRTGEWYRSIIKSGK